MLIGSVFSTGATRKEIQFVKYVIRYVIHLALSLVPCKVHVLHFLMVIGIDGHSPTNLVTQHPRHRLLMKLPLTLGMISVYHFYILRV